MALKKASNKAEIEKAADMLREKVMKFFDMQEANGDKFPSEARMRLYLNLTEEERDKLCEHPEYKRVFVMAKDMRMAWLEEHGAESKYASGCMNLLKQPINGGYMDKSQQTDSKLSIEMKMSGLGNDMSVFD